MSDYRSLINRDLPHEERSCSSKAAYVSRREALATKQRSRFDSGIKPYRCGYCENWHMGHNRSRKERAA